MGKNKLYNIKFPNKLAVATQYVESRFSFQKSDFLGPNRPDHYELKS